MKIQIVNFNLKELDHDAYAEFCAAVAAQFAAVPGLVSKTWISDPDSNTYGGIYLWDSAASMNAFGQSDLFRSVAANPSFANLTSKDFEVLETPSQITGGLARVTELA